MNRHTVACMCPRQLVSPQAWSAHPLVASPFPQPSFSADLSLMQVSLQLLLLVTQHPATVMHRTGWPSADSEQYTVNVIVHICSGIGRTNQQVMTHLEICFFCLNLLLCCLLECLMLLS